MSVLASRASHRVPTGARWTRLRWPEAAHGPRRRPHLAGAGPLAASIPSAVAVNDCGPPQSTGASIRSRPVGGDPRRCPAMLYRGVAIDVAHPGPAPAECHLLPSGALPDRAARMTSASPVLRGDPDRQQPAPLLTAARQRFPPPAGGHTGTESMPVDPFPVPRAICRLHLKPILEPKLVPK